MYIGINNVTTVVTKGNHFALVILTINWKSIDISESTFQTQLRI